MKNSLKTTQKTTSNNFAKFQTSQLDKSAQKLIKGGSDGIGVEDELLT